jgi:O-antigen/teichoic acid export membrane protein
MTAEKFHEAWVIVGLVAGGYMLKGCYLIFLPGIYFAKKLYLQSRIEWVVAILNIFLNLWLINIYGILGAAVGTFLSYLSLSVFAWLVARNYL